AQTPGAGQPAVAQPGAAASQDNAAAATPQQPEPAPAAAPIQPAPESAAASAAPTAPRPPETPFADLFAHLTARLVAIVVNVSTQATARANPPVQETAQNSPGRTLDEVFREFLGEKAAPG